MPNPKGINQYSKGGAGRKKRKGAPKLKSSMKGDPFKPQGADARKPQGRRI